MRQGGPNGRRSRGRHHGGNGGGGGGAGGNSGPAGGNGGRPRSAASLRYQTFDSNCNDLRVRGNAWQVHEKYLALARDALSSGDRVAEQNYLQHAEHYFRIIEVINEATAAEQAQRSTTAGYTAQQPEVPTNYYGTSGAPAPTVAEGAPGNSADSQAMPQAEVVRKQQPSPFFTTEEAEDHAPQGDDQKVATR